MRPRTYRTKEIRIRCTENTYKKWKKIYHKLAANGEISNYEDLLLKALNLLEDQYFFV